MGTPDPEAVAALMNLLESRYALRVIWALRDGQARTFRVLQDLVHGITPNTLNTRIKELREAGLVTHSGEGYCATHLGLDLAKRLNELQSFSHKWSMATTRKPGINPNNP